MDEPPPPLLDDDTLAAFTDAERTLDVNGRLFENRRSALVGTAPDVERTFFDSLVLKERLDVLEQDVNCKCLWSFRSRSPSLCFLV